MSLLGSGEIATTPQTKTRRSAPGALRRRARAGAWRVVVICSRGRGDSGEALAGVECNGGAMPSPSSCQSLSSHAGRRCSPA